MKNTLCELLDQATILGHRKTNKEIAEYLESCGVIVCRQDELPAADVQPVKRGRWFLRGGNWCCSACNRKTLLTLESNVGGCKEYGTVKTDYCPNCGAKMESED